MKKIQSGELREEIEIQQRGTGVKASGTPSGPWTRYTGMRAGIEVISGDESYEGSQPVARVTHEVRIRYYGGITSAMRVLWDGAILHVHSVLKDPARTTMVLRCEERA